MFVNPPMSGFVFVGCFVCLGRHVTSKTVAPMGLHRRSVQGLGFRV